MNHMSEIKNVFFAFILAFVVLIGWQFFFGDKDNSEKQQIDINQQKEISNDNLNIKLSSDNNIENNKKKDDNLSINNDKVEIKNPSHEEINYEKFNINIENEKLSAVFSPKGLSFEKIILKKYNKN